MSFHAVMTIMVIIITIRANHWSFQGENYPSVTCLSPGTAPKCPYYHHQGHSVCVCVSMWLTLWPPATLCSQPLKGPLSPSQSTGTMGTEWAAAAGGHCESVWGPAGRSAKTSSQWACSQWTGNLSCCIWDSQSWCVCVCHFLQHVDEMGKFFLPELMFWEMA